MSIAACGTNGDYRPATVIDTGCDWTFYIYLTDSDITNLSSQAKRQILTHNETRQARCEKETK